MSFARLFLLPHVRQPDPGSHSRLFFPVPPPHYSLRSILFFYREKTLRNFFPHWLASNWSAPTHATRSQQSIPFFVFCCCVFVMKKKKQWIWRWDLKLKESTLSLIVAAFEGTTPTAEVTRPRHGDVLRWNAARKVVDTAKRHVIVLDTNAQHTHTSNR